MIKIICPDPHFFSNDAKLYETKNFTIDFLALDNVNLRKCITNYDGILIRHSRNLDVELINNIKKNRFYIISVTTGTNHICKEFFNDPRISIIHLKSGDNFLNEVTATAEHALGLMIALSRNYSRFLLKDNQDPYKKERCQGHQLNNKTVGIIGYGRLGKIFGRYAMALGMKIIVHDPYCEKNDTKLKFETLDYLIQNSDVITLHVPLNSNTHHMLSSYHFSKMKDGVIIINTSRGEIIDTKTLIDYFNSGKIGGVGLDVIEDEYIQDSVLKKLIFEQFRKNENFIMTPHIGGLTFESISMTDIHMLNIFDRELQNLINKK